jgi:6-phosphogluconolactonase (cycloisomerase 2 family)
LPARPEQLLLNALHAFAQATDTLDTVHVAIDERYTALLEANFQLAAVEVARLMQELD